MLTPWVVVVFASISFDGCCAWIVSHPAGRTTATARTIIRWSTPPHNSIPSHNNNNNNNTTTADVYSQPALYDLAFGYRNYEDEVDFLLTEHERWAGSPATTVLELMAGPARHSLAAALDHPVVSRVVCVDQEPAMAEYAQQHVWQDENIDDEAVRDTMEYHVADVRNLQLTTPVDTAWILLGSFQHMVHFTDAVDCLQAARQALHHDATSSAKRGTLFIELPHPRELFQVTDCTRNEWTVPLDLSDGTQDELQILWGDAVNDVFDPITQIRQHSVSMTLQGSTTHQATPPPPSVDTKVPLRSFTAPELQALAALTGFEVAAWYGALEDGVAIDNEDLAFRMVCCLRTV